MLTPLVRRTWAPRGQTPVLYCWDRHDRLSVIGALSLSARTRRIGLYFAVHERNVTGEDVQRFLRQLQGHLRRDLIVVLDRWAVHRKAARALWADGSNRFWFEWLPPYAPDLNPVEHVWNHTKYADLANAIPQDLSDLQGRLAHSMDQTRRRPDLLRSFLHATKLKL